MSTKELIKFLAIARGSLEESKYLLHLSHRLAYFDDACYTTLKEEADTTAKMLNALIRSLKSKLP